MSLTPIFKEKHKAIILRVKEGLRRNRWGKQVPWGKLALIKCNFCSKSKWIHYAKIRVGAGQFCSIKCYRLSMKGRIPHRKMWKGDRVGYGQLHKWIASNKPKPALCENCHTIPPRDLANISQQYKRDINDFEWLCRKCHMTRDGRLTKLIGTNESRRTLFARNCKVCSKRFYPTRKANIFCSKSCSLKHGSILAENTKKFMYELYNKPYVTGKRMGIMVIDSDIDRKSVRELRKCGLTIKQIERFTRLKLSARTISSLIKSKV